MQGIVDQDVFDLVRYDPGGDTHCEALNMITSKPKLFWGGGGLYPQLHAPSISAGGAGVAGRPSCRCLLHYKEFFVHRHEQLRLGKEGQQFFDLRSY